MNNIYTDQLGRQWLTNSYVWQSPYNFNGSIGYANVRYVEIWAVQHSENVITTNFHWDIKHDYIKLDNDNAVVCAIYDDSGAKGMAVRCHTGIPYVEELVSAFKTLEDYPVFDEAILADVELEWLEEAIMEHQNTLLHYIYKQYPNFEQWWVDHYLDLVDYIPYSCRKAMNKIGYWPTFESDHCFLETDRFIDKWVDAFKESIKKHYSKKA